MTCTCDLWNVTCKKYPSQFEQYYVVLSRLSRKFGIYSQFFRSSCKNETLPPILQLPSHLVGTLGSPSQFTFICAGLSPPLSVESNRSWCWQSLLSTLGGGTATSVPTNVTTIVAILFNSGEWRRGKLYLFH